MGASADASVSRELFDALVAIHRMRVRIADTWVEVAQAPPRVKLARDKIEVTLALRDGAVQTSATTDAERALLAAIVPALQSDVARRAAVKAEAWAKLRELPVHASSVFGRAELDALHAAQPGAESWQLTLDDATSIHVTRGDWGRPANLLFVRRLEPIELADVDKDYTRVWLHDVDGTLHTTATTAELRAFVDELGALARPALEAMRHARAERIAHAIASAPAIDRDVLVDALSALTHGKTDVQPIADAMLLSTTDPQGYVTRYAEACREFGISEPVEGLHVIALLQQLPPAHLVYFDWKESMHEVLPMLARLLRAGAGIELDVARFAPRCDAWDRKPRRPALKAIAAELPGAVLVELKTSADAFALACIAPSAAARLKIWKSRAHLPFTALAPAPR